MWRGWVNKLQLVLLVHGDRWQTQLYEIEPFCKVHNTRDIPVPAREMQVSVHVLFILGASRRQTIACSQAESRTQGHGFRLSGFRADQAPHWHNSWAQQLLFPDSRC